MSDNADFDDECIEHDVSVIMPPLGTRTYRMTQIEYDLVKRANEELNQETLIMMIEQFPDGDDYAAPGHTAPLVMPMALVPGAGEVSGCPNCAKLRAELDLLRAGTCAHTYELQAKENAIENLRAQVEKLTTERDNAVQALLASQMINLFSAKRPEPIDYTITATCKNTGA